MAASAFMGLSRELRTRHNMQAIYCEKQERSNAANVICMTAFPLV
jgi:hypothetical protein